jgi:pimeloyl-ACP methyl ester carboxylesterase
MKKILLALVAALALAVAAPGQTKLPLEAIKLFDYDASQPLDVQQKVVRESEGIKVYDITYASPRGGRVTGFLVVPPGMGPFAGVVFGHWGPGNRTEFLPEALLYAEAGAVSVMIDYPWTRPAPWRRNVSETNPPEQDRETYAQAVVDLRRAIDLLLARPNVDPKRIAYVGHSYGAQWGAILCAVDRRLKTAVLAGGTPDMAAVWLESTDPALEEFRKNVGMEKIRKYIAVNSALDAIRFVPYAAPIPLLFQFARFEQYFNEAAMNRYFAAASQPKQVRWYDTGHDLNDVQALLDRAAWLEKHLAIRSLSPILEKRLKQKPY